MKSCPPPVDAGSDAPAPIEAGTDAGETGDADIVPTGCAGDWCVEPLDGITNVTLNAIWGSGPNDVWVVGTRGFAAHFDGSKWTVQRPNTLLSLFSIWGSGPNDVWAANSGKALYHWKGSAWEESNIVADSRVPSSRWAALDPTIWLRCSSRTATSTRNARSRSGP